MNSNGKFGVRDIRRDVEGIPNTQRCARHGVGTGRLFFDLPCEVMTDAEIRAESPEIVDMSDPSEMC